MTHRPASWNWLTAGRSVWISALVAVPWLNPFAPGPSPAIHQWLVSVVCLAVIGFIVSARYRSGSDWFAESTNAIALGWLIAALASSLIALLQYNGWAGQFTPWISASSSGEAYANLRQRNQLATLTNIGLIVVVCADYVSRHRRAACCFVGMLCMANAATASRTGLLQLVAVLGAVFVFHAEYRRRSVQLCLFGLGVYAFSATVLPSIAEVARGEAGQSVLVRLSQDLGCSSRKVLWTNTLELIAQRPWFGWGWGELDYAHYAHLFGGERFCAILDNAHNLPLHLAVELGLPVALLVCGAGVWAVLRARPWRETDPTRQLAWAVLALVGLHSMVEYPLWYGPFAMAVVLCFVLLWRPGALPAHVPTSNRGLAHVFRAAVAIIIIAIITYVGWDYARISHLYLAPEDRSTTYREDTLTKVSGSWLFRSQVEFAELTLTPLTRDNAASQNAMALRLLHYSPEPRLIEKAIESAVLLGYEDNALWHLLRYRAAFPDEHAAWVKQNAVRTGIMDSGR